MPDPGNDDEDGILDPLVALVRDDPCWEYFDPRHAQPWSSSSGSWGEIDAAFLEQPRVAVPEFPLDVLPSLWRDWVLDAAQATGAPCDYIVQSVMAVVAGLCGAGAVVRIGPRWTEPLVLWQAVVGPPSSGKSPAMAAVGELFAALEAEPSGDDTARAAWVPGEASLSAVADAVAANPRGVVLWRDDAPDWLARPVDAARAPWLQGWSASPASVGTRRIERFAVSLLFALPPDRLAGMLSSAEIASRFLFAWPALPAHRPLAGCKPARDDDALAALRRIARKAGTPADPLALMVDKRGLAALDAFLTDLQAELGETEGVEMAWLGKGRGTVARLAGILELLDWSTLGPSGPPGHISREQVERAQRLWSDYFRPHAGALFHRFVSSEGEQRARRVARWLRERGLSEVSREQVRCEALSRSVNAVGADDVLYRLQAAGIVSQVHHTTPARGRPPNRWLVNPRLATRLSAGNAGNTGNSGIPAVNRTPWLRQ